MAALRERNFRLYLFGQAVSNIGNWMQIVALGWFILQINNGSTIALGLLGLAQSLPVFALSLVGGMLADRFPRFKLLIVTQGIAMVLALVLALLSAQGKPPLWSLLLVAIMAASVTAIDNPARQTFISDLVSKDVLLNAVALNASIYNAAAVIGPTLAGLLLLSVGAAGCFLLNAVSFLAVLLALIVIGRSKSRDSTRSFNEKLVSRDLSTPVSTSSGKGLQRNSPILSSLRTLGRQGVAIIAVLGIAAVSSLLGRPYLLLMPAFAHAIFHVGPAELGLMVTSSGSGSLIGSLLLVSLQSSRWLDWLLLICGCGFGLVLVSFALLHAFIGALPVLVMCGAGATMTMTIANTMLQTYAPAEMRGRVMSLYTLIAAGLTPFGVLLISGLGTVIGLRAATLCAGVSVIIAVIIGVQCIKHQRALFKNR